MILQRFMAFYLVAVAAGVLAFTSSSFEYPAVISVIALAGVPARLTVALSVAKKNILLLVLAAVFLTHWNISPYENPEKISLIYYSLGYAGAQWMLAMMTLHLYLRLGEGLPPALPLMGCLAVIFAGNFVTRDLADHRGYQLLVLAYAGGVALYYVSGRKRIGGGQDRHDRRVVAAGLLALGLLMAAIAGEFVRRNADALQRFTAMRRGRSRVQTVGYDRPGELNSVDLQRQGNDRTVLWAESFLAPGYVRGLAMERLVGPRWEAAGTRSEMLPTPPPPPPPLQAPQPAEFLYVLGEVAPPGAMITIHPSPDTHTRVFVPLETQAVYAPVNRLRLSEHGTASSADLAGGLGYRAWVPESPPRPAEAPSADLLRRCIEPPEKLDERVVALARQILAGQKTTEAKIQAVTRYLTSNYQYSLSIRIPAGTDSLSHFLLEAKAAHCEYFASAAAVLLRLGGVPTRYVTGFVVQRYNRLGGYWYARNRDAHAWAEAWDEQAGRWVTVEATPSNGRPTPETYTWAGNFWDYLLFRLQQLREAVNLRGWTGLGLWVLGVLLELLGLLVLTWPGRVVLAAILLLVGRKCWRRWKGRYRPRPAGPELQQWRALLAKMDARVRRLGFVREPSETLHQFAARVAQGDASADAPCKASGRELLAQLYIRAATVRYDGPITPSRLEEIGEMLDSVR